MTPQLPLLLRIEMKMICIWHILRGNGVVYRADVTGEGTLRLDFRTQYGYVCESNILDTVVEA